MTKGPKKTAPSKANPNNKNGDTENNISSIVGPPAAHVEKPPPAAHQESETKYKCRWTNDLGIFCATVAGVIAVIAYTSVAAWQVSIARDTEIRQLRAYLEIGSQKAPEFTENKPARIVFETRNTGQTPAYHVTPSILMDIYPYPPPRVLGVFTPRPHGFTENVINPGRKSIGEAFSRRSFSAEEIAKIKDGTTARLYVWGTLFYLDTFGIERHTHVCEIMGGRDMKSGEECPHVGAD